MRSRIAGLLAMFMLIVSFAAVVPQTASAVNFFGDACNGTGSQSAACNAKEEALSGSDGIILRVSALLSIIAGLSAVVAIMIAGIMFVTAGGDTNKTSTARKLITYAVVGLIVIVLARAIVVFIINAV